MTRSRRAAALAVAVLLALLASMTGCTDDRPPRTVVLVTYSGYELPKAAVAAFTARTGYRVELRAAGDAGEALNKAILTAGRPEGDVFFGVDTTFLTRASSSDAFARYQAPAVAGLDPAVRQDTTGTFTPVDVGDVCVNADAGWFEAHGLTVPATFDDLVDPRYRSLLVIENPARSSPGLAFLAGTHARYGDGAESWWRRLRDNDVEVADSWSDAYDTSYTVNGGDRPLVVSYASSPPAEVVFSEGRRTTPASSVLEATCVRQVEFAAVLRGASNPLGARALVDEMLRSEWQRALPLSNFVYPVVAATPLPEVFTASVPTVEDPIVLDPVEVGRRRSAWIDAWRDVME